MSLTKKTIDRIIQEAYNDSPLNHFQKIGLPEEPMWQPPVIGCAAGSDDLFRFFQKDIGHFYWSPAEAFAKKHRVSASGDPIEDKDLTVVSIGFAQTDATKKVQGEAEGMPSLRWFVTRGEWEAFVTDFCIRAVSGLEASGARAAAIDLMPDFSRMISPQYGFASNWSHRHTAYAAGLGTFGLSEGLITRSGKAMRFTSLILEAELPADERSYHTHQAWCSFYANGSCGDCMKRCPVNAITPEGHDKERCSAYLERLKKDIGPELVTRSHYVAGCGLCQSRIPCQDGVPGDIMD
jgi:epoxyqueuosine reductase